jgi:hypothetical protein
MRLPHNAGDHAELGLNNEGFCNELFRSVAPEEIQTRRREIRERIEQFVYAEGEFLNDATPQQWKQLFRHLFQSYDNEWFGSRLNAQFLATHQRIEIVVGHGAAAAAAAVVAQDDESFVFHVHPRGLVVLQEQIDESSTSDIQIAGLSYKDWVDCLLVAFEHQLVRLVVLVYCERIYRARVMSTNQAKIASIAFKVFGHSMQAHQMRATVLQERDEQVHAAAEK